LCPKALPACRTARSSTTDSSCGIRTEQSSIGTPDPRQRVAIFVWGYGRRPEGPIIHSNTVQAWGPTDNSLHNRGQIREEIDLDRSGDEHFGTLTIDSYDPAGNFLAHFQGTVHATRITVKTDLKDLF
jgi:hypothetical protein